MENFILICLILICLAVLYCLSAIFFIIDKLNIKEEDYLFKSHKK